MSNIKDTLRYKHVFSSLYFCSHALQELRTLIDSYELKEANKLLRQAPFNFYRASLTYVLCLEYCKLFSQREPKERMSNVLDLWDLACEQHPCLVNERKTSAIVSINRVKKGELLNLIINLRNKRFAHSDADILNKPFNIRSFSEKELEEIAANLDAGIAALSMIAQKEDDTVLGFPHQLTGSSQTRNFIHTAAITRAFHEKNWNLAYSQGFQVLQQKIVKPKM